MRIVFMGPPGAGKGTQAERLVASLGVLHFSTGEMLREAARQGTDVGKLAARYMHLGQLVPDNVVVQITQERLEQPDCAGGFLLDGFPRTLAQAEALDRLLRRSGTPLDLVLDITVDSEELFRRMAGRGRDDDARSVITERFRQYESQTKPVLNYYKQCGVLASVNGRGPVEEVAQRVAQAVKDKQSLRKAENRRSGERDRGKPG